MTITLHLTADAGIMWLVVAFLVAYAVRLVSIFLAGVVRGAIREIYRQRSEHS